MKRICLACLALLAAAWPAALARADHTAAAPPADHVPQIAVVRAVRLTHDCAEAKQLTQTLSARFNEMKQEEGKRQTEVNQLIDQQNQLKAGSAQWLSIRDTIDDKRLANEVWGKKMEMELDRRQKAGLKSIYEHVAQAVQAIAEKQHLDLVLADNSPDLLGPELDKITLQQFQTMLALRGVLYATKKADITDDVLMLVDANFKNQSASAAQAPGH
jgi:Skp family chaperone for outer membrane proteins